MKLTDKRGIVLPENATPLVAPVGLREAVAETEWINEAIRRENEAEAKGDLIARAAYHLLVQGILNGRVTFKAP